jgi:hypothetical protein
VRLPQGKDVVIDAKMTLVAYERYFNAEETTSPQLPWVLLSPFSALVRFSASCAICAFSCCRYVIVRLPQGKDVVIDAKMTLVAYERYFNAEDDYTSRRPEASSTRVRTTSPQLPWVLLSPFSALVRFSA